MEKYKPFGMGLTKDHLPKSEKEADSLWEQIKPLKEGMENPNGKENT